MAAAGSSLTQQMDQLYEFEREPVTEDKLKPGRYFAGLFAGEHVAATEFVIGAFFVLHGVTMSDLLIGLLVGNLLAVLSWTFICAPIATRTRLTLYWYLRKIAGPGMTAIYNVANAVLYCVLAGAMISVSATAIGLGVGVPLPEGAYPDSLGWIVITLAIGAVVTLLAIFGFEQLSRFSSVCSPWIFVAFIAGAVASFPALGIRPDLSNLITVLDTRVWNGIPDEGQMKYGVWHIAAFAWLANLAMHVGLSDMALFRYAKNWKYGLYSFFGMYTGHFLAWICSGIMVAAVAREMNPGLMAYEALGLAGAFAVLVAGWTTANPTMYRVGLALQVVTPNWPRWKVTLVAGTITSVLSCFPLFFTELLAFVATYGLILMPVGAIVFAEHWILPRLGVEPFLAERRGWFISPAAAIVWGGTLALCFLLYRLGVHEFFLWIPGYLFALALYSGLQVAFSRSARSQAHVQPASKEVSLP